ncbi:hypothetical protein BH23BAC3_BH23BAC3_32660 [soil metagenome]
MRLPKVKYLFQSRALVLMYHRINTPDSDPWNLSVSPEKFEKHLKVLKNNFSVVSTDELVRQLNAKKIRNRSVAITFDDGYLDNFITAKPILEKYSIPATFFITDSYLGNYQSFWWDQLENIIVHTEQLPSFFSINFQDNVIQFTLGDEAVLNDKLRTQHLNYKASKPPTLRTELYLKLWKIFSPLSKEKQTQLLQLIRNWAGLTENDIKVNGCMSVQQLKQLADNPLFTIGGHTKSHLSLTDHGKYVQEREILENQEFLETHLKTKLDHFAYPSGNYNESTVQLLKASSFSSGFTTTPQNLTQQHTNIYKIGRFQVNNQNGDTFSRTLLKWLKS